MALDKSSGREIAVFKAPSITGKTAQIHIDNPVRVYLEVRVDCGIGGKGFLRMVPGERRPALLPPKGAVEPSHSPPPARRTRRQCDASAASVPFPNSAGEVAAMARATPEAATSGPAAPPGFGGRSALRTALAVSAEYPGGVVSAAGEVKWRFPALP
jgi:hypothetical protein